MSWPGLACHVNYSSIRDVGSLASTLTHLSRSETLPLKLHIVLEAMKTKRRAIRLPSHPGDTYPTANANIVNPPLETHITCSLLTNNTVEPHSSSKKTRFDTVMVRRSQRIRSAVHQHPMIRDAEPVIQIIDPSGSEQEEHRNHVQFNPEPELNQSQFEDIEPAPQNQFLAAESQKESKDGDPSGDNSIELEPEEAINDKPKGSKNKSERLYRTLYVESQKKLEKLTNANNELSKKLAVAEGKLEVYEKGSGILSTILDKTKDLFMTSALSNASEQAIARTTPRATPKRKTSMASKRKKPVASFR